MDTRVTFSKVDTEKRLAYGEVYIPMMPDSQGDFMSRENVEKMAHEFMKNGFLKNIDTNHDLQKSGAYVVESFVAREGDKEFIEGAWVLAVHIPDDDDWASVKKGEFGGFSMHGTGQRVETTIEIEVPDDGVVKGETQVGEDHTHEYVVSFDKDGNFMGGATSEAAGHVHLITGGTVTETADGHAHRYNFIEALVPNEN